MEEKEKTRIKEMKEIDAEIEKINYDLLGIESRKKEYEDKKAEKQKEIEKLEKEKEKLTMRSEDMSKARKVIYIIVNLQKDLKEIDSLNSRIVKLKSETQEIQDNIDIQNNLYLKSRNEKDKFLEERRKLYLSNEVIQEKNKDIEKNEDTNNKEQKLSREEKFILNLNRLIEEQINAHLNKAKQNNNSNESEDEME